MEQDIEEENQPNVQELIITGTIEVKGREEQ